VTQAMTMSLTEDRSRVPALEREQRLAFEALVHRHTHFVFRVAHALLRNASDAEEVAQETFLKLHRSGAWQSMRDERAFLAKMAWRLALDRKRSTATGRSLRVDIAQFDTLRGTGRDPEQSALTGDAVGLVHGLIDDLPDELREPLLLSAVDEMNSREIAGVLGVKEGTVRTRLMRARQMLKDKLADQTGGHHARR
jgi:RNA polymerase sigma-70 factor (ECF subfamily)